MHLSRTHSNTITMDYIKRIEKESQLSAKLRELDRQRDHFRAQFADLELTDPATIAKRKARREKEMDLYGHYIQPGPWDADMDEYQEDEYTFELSDGYTGRLVRGNGGTWNGYVKVPKEHWAVSHDEDYMDFWYGKAVPQEITFHEGQTIGFDHSHYHDCMPNGYPRYNHIDNWQGNRTSGNRGDYLGPPRFLGFEDVKAQVIELANFLKNEKNKPTHVAEPEDT